MAMVANYPDTSCRSCCACESICGSSAGLLLSFGYHWLCNSTILYGQAIFWSAEANSHLWLGMLASPKVVQSCRLAMQIVILLHESQQWRKLVREEGELWRNLSREIIHDIGFI